MKTKNRLSVKKQQKVAVQKKDLHKRILVFDDNPKNLIVAKKAYSLLKPYGFTVETVTSPDVALDKITREECDILVSDLLCPRNMISPEMLELYSKQMNDTQIFFESNPTFYTHKKEDGQIWYSFNHHKWPIQIEVPSFDEGLEKVFSTAYSTCPIGIVLYDAAESRGIEANIVTDTHRHVLGRLDEGRDIRGMVLPLLLKYPSLVVELTEGAGKGMGYFDQSRIRTNVRKNEIDSWFGGSGYGWKTASFLPWKDLNYEQLKSKFRRVGVKVKGK